MSESRRDEQNPEPLAAESEEPEVVAHSEEEQEEDNAGCIINNSNSL